MQYHLHRFKFDCQLINGHNHKITGLVRNTLGFENFHVHMFYGVSTYTNHTHYFSGVTGLPVKSENGHIHRMEGLLEMNNSHEHSFIGYTFEETSYISGKLFKEAFIL